MHHVLLPKTLCHCLPDLPGNMKNKRIQDLLLLVTAVVVMTKHLLNTMCSGAKNRANLMLFKLTSREKQSTQIFEWVTTSAALSA